MGFVKQYPADHNGKDTLDDIPCKNDQSRLGSQNPKGVGRAGVSASVLSDVDSVQLSVNESGLEQTK